MCRLLILALGAAIGAFAIPLMQRGRQRPHAYLVMRLDCLVRGSTVAAADGTRETDLGRRTLGHEFRPGAAFAFLTRLWPRPNVAALIRNSLDI